MINRRVSSLSRSLLLLAAATLLAALVRHLVPNRNALEDFMETNHAELEPTETVKLEQSIPNRNANATGK